MMRGFRAAFGGYQNGMLNGILNRVNIAHRGSAAIRIEDKDTRPSPNFNQLGKMRGISGMQPLSVQGLPHLWVYCDGEIYNHKQNRDTFNFNYETESDAESILHLYNHGGIDFAARNLDGVFCFILHDEIKGSVFLGRDLYGIRPGFKLYTPDVFLAACSEAKGLMDFLDDDTREIQTLRPGHYEEYALDVSGKPRFSKQVQYYGVGQSPAFKTSVTTEDKDVSYNIRRLLTEAVMKRMMSDKKIGCIISGGVDSSLVGALTAKYAKEVGIQYQMKSFTVGMEDSPDIIAARKVASHIGTEHHEVIYTLDEGISALKTVIGLLGTYDPVTVGPAVAMYLMTQYISNQTNSKVMMSGEGSDEITQGYLYYHKAPNPEKADGDSRRLLKDFHLYDGIRADRTTAAHGLAIQLPFLDHQFTSYFLSLPAAMRVPQDGIEKYLIRKAFHGTGILPDEILWRPKLGFCEALSPTRTWRMLLQDHAESQISDHQMNQSAVQFPFNTPQTKEAYLYRQMFEEVFPGQGHLIPYAWRDRWVRAMNPFKQNHEKATCPNEYAGAAIV